MKGVQGVKLRRCVLCRLFGLLCKICVLRPFADKLGGFFCFVYFNQPVAAHFMCDFIAGLLWFFDGLHLLLTIRKAPL